ncbi:hypothetical protein BD769DRAFT_1424245, partial [Suillus cothurnatus]
MATDDEPEMKPMSLYLWLLRLWWLVRLSVAVSPSHAFVSIPTLDIQIYVPSLADEEAILSPIALSAVSIILSYQVRTWQISAGERDPL